VTLILVIDTDVLIKCSCYSLLDEIRPPSGVGSSVGILGVTRFVAGKYLERRGEINDRAGARHRFANYIRRVTILEPTDEELALASAFEDAGARLGLDLDIGESQLYAIAILRTTPLVLTGDKRAIAGAESLQQEMSQITALRGRIACLEQALIGITEKIGVSATRMKGCAEPRVDRSLTICFECHSPDGRMNFSADGLASYVRSLRAQASTLLYTHDAMWGSSSS
jgi:hypothetical protein